MTTTSKKAKVKKPTNTAKPAAKTVVLFGLRDQKPHAARFTGENDALLARAAAAMGLRVAVPVTKRHFEIVAKLPAGRIHAAGDEVVPTVDKQLYDLFNALVGGEPCGIAATLPKDWNALAAGHLVIVQESIEDGWWPAIVLKRSDDTLTLKWRDDPTLPSFRRPLSAVALPHAT